MHLIFILLYKTSALVGSEFGGTWEDPGGGFNKFADKTALKQDQTLHMEGKLRFILYFSTECKENNYFLGDTRYPKFRFRVSSLSYALGKCRP